jgi:hypothetical protein
MSFYSFPSIEQYRHTIKNVRYKIDYENNLDSKDEDKNNSVNNNSKGKEEKIYVRYKTAGLPTLTFMGTVKLHGCHSDIVYTKKTNSIHYQSKNQIITKDDDQTGFVSFITSAIDEKQLIEILSKIECQEYVMVGGEFCGGNIQKGVVLNQLPKMFVVYNVTIDHERQNIKDYPFLDLPENHIHYILKFQHYEMDIDFNKPELSQNALNEITLKVEEECPVGKYFGVNGIGEGVVWTCLNEGYLSSKFWFKVKGGKHSSTKVKKLANVNVDKVNSVNEFVENVTTESRLEQGYTHVKQVSSEPLSKKDIETFIRWVINDVVKEESDTMEENNLVVKDVSSKITNVARMWFINKLKEK